MWVSDVQKQKGGKGVAEVAFVGVRVLGCLWQAAVRSMGSTRCLREGARVVALGSGGVRALASLSGSSGTRQLSC